MVFWKRKAIVLINEKGANQLQVNNKSNKKLSPNQLIRVIFNLSLIGIGLGVIAGSLLKIVHNKQVLNQPTFINTRNKV